MPSSVPQSILIPVETLNREFDAKLLLALKAAGRGLKPIIGGRTLIHRQATRFPPSIYLAKGIRTGNRLMLSILDALGHVIVALDEEALIPVNEEALMLMFDEETFNRPRLLYAWGRRNADLWRRYEGYRGAPIVETGNPRIDLLRPEARAFHAEDVARLRERHGAYVLFSSNFSLVNHFIPDHFRFRVAAEASKDRAEELKGGLRGHKQALFDRFRALVPKLAGAIAPATLVVRPHPSEDIGAWEAVGAGLPNVRVAREGPIAPWLMGASALLHNGCTSAVEAAVVGLAAFAYRPVVNDAFDARLPNALSVNLSEDDDMVAAIRDRIGGPARAAALSPEQRRLLGEHIASVDGALSSDRILDTLEERRDALEARPYPALAERVAGRLRHGLRGAVRSVTTRARAGKSSAAYTETKFPGISEAEVNRRIARFRAAIPDLPAMRARERMPSVFELEPD